VARLLELRRYLASRLERHLRVEHIICGAFANASEETAFRAVERRLNAEPGDGRAYILTNLVHGVGSGRQPDEIDMVVIAPGGAVVIEVKHWDRGRLKAHAWEADDQADLVTLKAKRVATQLRRVKCNLGLVPATMLLTKEAKSFFESGRLREVRGVRRRRVVSHCRESERLIVGSRALSSRFGPARSRSGGR
jgi:Nuclease-related domain